jgi:hypothetical protein
MNIGFTTIRTELRKPQVKTEGFRRQRNRKPL